MPSPITNRILFGGGNYDPDSLSYFARLPAGISNTTKTAIDIFIRGVKIDNSLTTLASGFDYMHILGGLGSATNAVINVISSSFTHLPVNTPTWANTGYTGNGATSYLNSQYTPSTSAIVLSQNDNFLATYTRTNAQTGYSSGTINAAATIGLQVLPRFTDDTFRIRNNSATFGSLANTDSRGFFVSQRIDVTNIHNWKNGVSVLTTASASVGLSDVPIWHLANNFNNVIQLPSTIEQSFDCVGKATVINQAKLYTRVQTLGTALGWAV